VVLDALQKANNNLRDCILSQVLDALQKANNNLGGDCILSQLLVIDLGS
jgi:hypothetical protein